MENCKVLRISDLVRGGCPLTATTSPHSLPSKRTATFPSTSTNPNPNPNPIPDSPKVLNPLDQPAIIVGTLTLPDATTPPCPYNSCFQFSDGSATVCCDILHLDIRILGVKIRVLAWNFIPAKRGGGFLEIIRWSFLDSGSRSNVESFPLTSGSSSVCEESSKSRHRLHGVLESISPISVVPCTSGDSNYKSTADSKSSASTNLLRGFLVQISVCECKFCRSYEPRLLDGSIQEHYGHSFTKSVFLYFCGSASSWHPVFTKLVGNIVYLSGLKKKLVYIGEEESRLMYTTTEKTILHPLGLHEKCIRNEKTSIKGKGECGTYIGIVRGIYMQGMVVELDSKAWLLLTDQLLTPPHSVRVGALISVRNVHFVNPKFSWTKMLILGACFKTSITVEHFSPLENGCHLLSQSQSMLGNFIGSLVFSARLWVLLLVSCFRKKFAGILSDKEILGAKHKEGLTQMYASLHLPSLTIRSPHGVFMALCKHDICGSGCEQYTGNLKLVVPLFSFICHCQRRWIRNLHLGNDDKILQDNKQYSLPSCEGRSYGRSIRKVFSSEDIGIVLIGSLKISPSSGRIQLVDATASIDVLIPDLPSTWNSNSIYEVIDYSVVIEGVPGQLNHTGLIKDELFSCRSVFHFTQLARDENLTVHVYFFLGSVTSRNVPFYPHRKEEYQRPESGIFHMLYVTHKFPVLQKGDMGISESSSVFVEAFILPWNLFLPGKDEFGHLTKDSGNMLGKSMEYSNDGNHQDSSTPKRYKVNHESSWALSALVENRCKVVRELNACSNSHMKHNEKKRNCSFTSHEVSCLAAIKGVNDHTRVHLVNLNCTGAMSSSWSFCRPTVWKVMLEFKPESYYKYQLLQIGCYYITNHDREDSFCNLMDSGNANGVKIFVTTQIHLWSLSFVSDEVLKKSNSTKYPTSVGPFIGDEFLCNTEVLLKMFDNNSMETHSDVFLFLPANTISFIKPSIKEMDVNNIIPPVTPEGIAEVSSCGGTVVPSPVLLPKSNCLLPEGNLKSLRGNVLAAHGVDQNYLDANLSCQNLGCSFQSRFFNGFASSSCIHVLVIIASVLSKHAFPVGFGPGVDATFHRVLELGGQKRWMLTPVSFIVINSIEVVNGCSDKCSDHASNTYDASLDTVSSCLIFQLLQRFDYKPMLSHCRVVAVIFMILERKNRKHVHLQPKLSSRQELIDIPLACFVLDDGSSSCCCWADADRAATLLRLHEKLPQRAFESNNWTLNGIEKENSACSTNMSRMERMLKMYKRITVKNYGSLFDSSYQDLAVCASSDTALSSLDEKFVRSLVFNACFGTQWRIIASPMDLDAVRRLTEENLSETQPNVHSMSHIWAKEVHNINSLTEARNAIQELL